MVLLVQEDRLFKAVHHYQLIPVEIWASEAKEEGHIKPTEGYYINTVLLPLVLFQFWLWLHCAAQTCPYNLGHETWKFQLAFHCLQ